MKKLFKGAWYILVGIGAVFTFFFLSGSTKRLKKADTKMKKAMELRNKADAIDAYIEKLKAKSELADEEVAQERERIEKIDDLEELKNEFTKLGY